MGQHFWSVIWFTAWQSALTTVLAILLGGGLALIERYHRITPPRWFRVVWSSVLFLPPLIIATSFILVFGRNSWWYQITDLQLLYRPGIVVLAHLYYNIPLAYFLIRSKLTGLSQHTTDAAVVMGTKPIRLIRTIWWPELKSTVLNTAFIVNLYCWTSFVIPLQLGGSQAKTIEVWLYQTIILYHQYPLAGTVIGLQAIIGFMMIAVLSKQTFFQPIIAYSSPAKPTSWLWYILYLILGTMIAWPLLQFVLRAVHDANWETVQQLWNGSFFQRLGWTSLLSLVIILSSVFISLLLKQRSWFSLAWLVISPVSLGFIWLALLGQGTISLSLALLLSLLPLSHLLIAQRLQQQPRHLLETATVLGANAWQRWIVQLHWLRPTLQQVAVVGVTLVLGDITLSHLLADVDQPTAMSVAYDLLSSYHFAAANLGLVIILCTIFILQAGIYANRRAT